jgi:hypothetical protein
MKSILTSLTVAGLVGLAAVQTPDSWDGLVKARSPRADAVFLAPDAEFRAYTKIMLDPTEVAFKRNFLRDYNRTIRGSDRISDREAAEAVAAVRTGFEEIFVEEYRRAGYEVVTQPGSDVLRLRTAVLDMVVVAPDRMSSGVTRTYSYEAGEATLVIEARDSISGAILGRVVDRALVGDDVAQVRNRAMNRADFVRLFREWARASVRGLETLKTQSPAAGSP